MSWFEELLQRLPVYFLMFGVFYLFFQMFRNKKDESVPDGGWKCPKCGRIHTSHESFCTCGTERVPTEEKKPDEQDKSDSFAEIRKYKELLDDGIITQEEFDVKKKQLFDL